MDLLYFSVGIFASLIQLNSLDRPGFVYGAFQSYARAFYAELLPPGEEARWQVFCNIHRSQNLIRRNRYGLFSITDKVSLSVLQLPVTIDLDFIYL